MSEAPQSKPRHPWRENIEALTVAIIMAVTFKYFALEAYQIPTGSMQPTLMGQDFRPEPEGAEKSFIVGILDALPVIGGGGGSVKDRILVDKLSFHFRDPERFEVVVFKYPLNRAQNFVKRLVGMPNEGFRIEHGDLWRRGSPAEDWQHIRRPERVLAAQLKSLDRHLPADGIRWSVEPASAGSSAGRACSVREEAVVRFVARGREPITDHYYDGYPPEMQKAFEQERHAKYANNEVGDLRVEGRVRAKSSFQTLLVELTESGRSYVFEIPGPAAQAAATTRISSETRGGAPSPVADKNGATYRMPADRWIDFRAQNIDDVLTLSIDGDVAVELDVPPCDGSRPDASVALRVLGGEAELDDLRVWRDIYYTHTRESGEHEWQLGRDQYFMLGDNTQESSDSREWKSIDLAWDGMLAGSEFVRGNLRGRREGSPNNPADTNPLDKRFGATVLTFFRDTFGELWVFDRKQQKALPDGRGGTAFAPFVPRHLIVGRAVAVFWPLSIKYGAYRWKWVR